MNELSVAVVILNYNNKKFFERFLGGVVEHSAPHTVYIADNGSSDNSLAYATTMYPQVKIVRNNGNFGYADGYNRALAQIEADVFVLLNSDVEVTAGWIEPVLDQFAGSPELAACQPAILDQTQKNQFEYAGAAGGFIDTYGYPFCRGRIFNTLEQDQGQYKNVCEVFWATGACMFVRREAFERAGGFDPMFFAHMEEIDLCWRMKNFGYTIAADPRSVVYHVGGGTLAKISPHKTYLNFRNNLSTLTKNHPSKGLFIKILFRLVLDGVAGIKFLLEGAPMHCLAVLRAHFSFYAWIPRLLRNRRSLKHQSGFAFSLHGAYNGNIVYDYFIRKKHRFSDLDAALFLDKKKAKERDDAVHQN